MKKSQTRTIIVIVVLIAVVGAGFLFFGRKKKLKYKTAVAASGEILAQVSATGALNPVNQVVVGSQVSGILDTVLVDYNDHVKAGQVLARIDPRNYQSALLQAQANLTSARVSLEQAQRDYSNAESLYPANLISGDQLIQAKTTYELAQTKVTQAQANYNQAQTNLAYTTITAPMSGLVVARKVDGGQTVAASFSAPELFDIADLSKMQVEVSIQEADVGKLDTGMKATFKVDAYPLKTFEGKLVQIRNDPIITQNVVTYVGIVHVDNSDLLLKPGMTADVKIEVTHVPNVLVVPSTALNAKMGTLLGLAQPRTASGGRSGGTNAGAQGGAPGGRMGTSGPTAAQPTGQSVGRNAGTRSGPSGSRPDTGGTSPAQPGNTSARWQGNQPQAAESLVLRSKSGSKTQTLYVLEKGVPSAREVQIGANDSYNTEIKSGLKEGEVVILGIDQGKVNPFAQQNRPPGGGFR